MTKIATLSFIAAISFTASSAWASSTACSLLETPLPTISGLSNQARQSYLQKLRSECDLATSYKNLRQNLMSRYDVSLERVTEYQAMRFVRRQDFIRSQQQEIPVQLTYQIRNADYNLPNEQKSSVIWDNWAAGVRQLPTYLRKAQQNNGFSFQDLQTVHIGFFTLSDEAGDAAWDPNKGELKPASTNDNYWWAFNSANEAAEARRTVEQINAHYNSLGLLPSLGNEQLNRVLDVRRALRYGSQTEYVEAIYSTSSRAVRPHVDSILGFLNGVLTQAHRNQHIRINNQLLTPAETAYLVQKYYVGVHPFTEGNGRTSRFMQELLLAFFELPHGPSGDLMDIDVLSTFDQYYSTAIQKNKELLTSVQNCFAQYDALNLGKQLALTNQNRLPYNCRILRSR